MYLGGNFIICELISELAGAVSMVAVHPAPRKSGKVYCNYPQRVAGIIRIVETICQR